ncbi:MAG: Sir2 family NAD-dependent protein deacetylase [Alphaproteobacteria bacterium]
MSADDAAVEALRGMFEKCRRAVVFSGAGISTESGIPDYRSPGGIWTKYQPVDFNDFLASDEMRREFWRRKFATHGSVESAAPSRGHRAVAELVRRGTVASVITQNVDGLHQRSGVPDDRVIELHGNTTYARCLDCGERYELEPIRVAFATVGTLPLCRTCGGLVKTATISFGQAMPEDEMRRAEVEVLECDLFLAVGSSLRVYPAAGFPGLAKHNGARLAILNREPTEIDGLADLVLHREIGPTLGEVVGVD